MMRKKGSSGLALVLYAILAVGCGQNSVYEESRILPGDFWHKDSALVFEPGIADTSEVVNIGFVLNHKESYPYSNLWLFVNVNGPGGEQQTDTIEYFLARPDGEWLGKGSDSSRKLYWLYKGGVKLRHAGTYGFSIRQGMRRDSLEGINALTLWIEEAVNGKE